MRRRYLNAYVGPGGSPSKHSNPHNFQTVRALGRVSSRLPSCDNRSSPMDSQAAGVAQGERFQFGKNWASFLTSLTDHGSAEAEMGGRESPADQGIAKRARTHDEARACQHVYVVDRRVGRLPR
jgi:hypothetical protein